MIEINIQKAKEITHDARREAREKEFVPFDEVISKRIPGNDYDIAESERVSIREKYKTIQSEIDDCNDESRLRDILKKF
tara:strand:- start:108 stop:344 length:237 start_codon:yes stop_codon:yes gene_type:complete